MTWLNGLPDGETDWERLAQISPDAFQALAGLFEAAWKDVDPVLVELCRLRAASLLRYDFELGRRSDRARQAGLTDAKVAELPSWPTSPLFSETERAALALAEQFVMDANGVTDDLVADVTRHLGPEGCCSFVQALSVLETFQRACATLGIRSAPSVDELAGVGRQKAQQGRGI